MTLTDCKYYVLWFLFFSRRIMYFLLILIDLWFFFIYFFYFLFVDYIRPIDFYINWIFYFVTAPLNRVTWIHGAIKMLSLLLLLLLFSHGFFITINCTRAEPVPVCIYPFNGWSFEYKSLCGYSHIFCSGRRPVPHCGAYSAPQTPASTLPELASTVLPSSD